MRITAGIVALAACATGLTAAGMTMAGAQSPPPLPVKPLSREALADQMASTPRLMTMEIRRGEAPGVVEKTELCVDKAMVHSLMSAVGDRPPGERAAATSEAAKGCSHSLDRRPDGVTHLEMTCDAAKGARGSFRMVADMGPHAGEVHRYVETQLEDAKGSGTRTLDIRTHWMSACPADLKPGQMRAADGTVRDGAAAFERLGQTPR